MAALLAELNQIELRSQPKKAPAPPVSKLFASAHSVRAPPRAPTGINDLPDEVLLRIFGFREAHASCSPASPRRTDWRSRGHHSGRSAGISRPPEPRSRFAAVVVPAASRRARLQALAPRE